MANDIGPTSGRQVIDAGGGHSVVIVAGGRAYFRGDAAALAGYYQFPVTVAREYAGKWMSLGPGDTGYAQVSGAVTLASDFSQIAIHGPLAARPVTMPDGRQAIAIAGTAYGPTGTPDAGDARCHGNRQHTADRVARGQRPGVADGGVDSLGAAGRVPRTGWCDADLRPGPSARGRRPDRASARASDREPARRGA